MPIYTFGQKILDIFKNAFKIRHAYYKGIKIFTRRHKLTIYPTPSDATVTIGSYTHTGATASDVWLGYTTDWSVEKEDYGKITGTWKADSDEVLNVTLRQNVFYFSLIMNTPARANITFTTKKNGIPIDERVQNNVTNFSHTLESDSASSWTFDYKIEATGYNTVTGTWNPTVDGNFSQNITLTKKTYTVTINTTPSNATCKINGAARKTLTVEHGTTVTWEVSATNYATQTGSFTCTSNKTLNITLVSTQPAWLCYQFSWSDRTIVPNSASGYLYIQSPAAVNKIAMGPGMTYNGTWLGVMAQWTSVQTSANNFAQGVCFSSLGGATTMGIRSISGNNIVLAGLVDGIISNGGISFSATRYSAGDIK